MKSKVAFTVHCSAVLHNTAHCMNVAIDLHITDRGSNTSGGSVVVGRWTYDREVTGSTPGRCIAG